MLEFIIYGILLQGEMTGYEIKRFMTLSTSLFFDASFGSIYPMLQRLERKGTLRSVDSVGAGRFKRRFALTDSGRAAFDGWIRQPIPFDRSRNDFLVSVFFLDRIPAEEAAALLRGLMDEVGQELEELEQVEPVVRPLAARFEFATLEFGKGHYQYLLAWCEGLLQSLGAGGKGKVS